MTYDIKVRCSFCDRFIPIQAVESAKIRIKCSDRKCKEWNDIKIVMLTDLLGANK